MPSCHLEFLVKPVWRKPWFKEGFTEYHVVRKMTCKYNAGSTYNAYTNVTEDVLHKCLDLKEAVLFRADLVNNDVK